MTPNEARRLAAHLFSATVPVIRVIGIIKTRGQWYRDIKDPEDDRIGPWFFPSYEILDETTWTARRACLYLVSGADGEIRYVGESKNSCDDRWRMSPALTYPGNATLPRQLFHRRCWREIETEAVQGGAFPYEVRVTSARQLEHSLKAWNGSWLPLAPSKLSGEEGKYVKDVEKALRKFRAAKCPEAAPLFCWNKN